MVKGKPREVYLLAGGEGQRREQPFRAVYALIGVLTGSGEYIHASPRVGYAYCLQGSVGGYGVLVTAHAVKRPGFPIANEGQCGIEQINRINVMLGIITRQGVVRSRACRLGVHHHRAKIGHIIISHIRAARTEQLVGTTHDLARDAQRRRQYPAITHGLGVIIDAYAVRTIMQRQRQGHIADTQRVQWHVKLTSPREHSRCRHLSLTNGARLRTLGPHPALLPRHRYLAVRDRHRDRHTRQKHKPPSTAHSLHSI